MGFNIDELYKNEVEAEEKIISFFNQGKIVSLKNACGVLWAKNEVFGIYFLSIKNLDKSKGYLSICGLLDVYQINNFNSRLLDYGLNHITYALLSENEELIQEYGKLRYQRGENAELSMDEMVAEGEMPIWCNTVQYFMVNDIAGVERNLNIIENKTLKNLPKKEEGLKDDYEFYKALHYKNKPKLEEILEKLVSPKVHKKRNTNPVLSQYISHPALGYAKLAWRHGIEVEVDSPLIPKEILPIRPLNKYEVPYDFLKQ